MVSLLLHFDIQDGIKWHSLIERRAGKFLSKFREHNTCILRLGLVKILIWSFLARISFAKFYRLYQENTAAFFFI